MITVVFLVLGDAEYQNSGEGNAQNDDYPMGELQPEVEFYQGV